MAQFYSANRRVTTCRTIALTIDDLDSFGQGVAHHHGKALFVQGALPGEVAEASISEERRHYSRGVAQRILTASPERIEPRCPHYSRCGGCQQQHVSPALQQRSKAKALRHLLLKQRGETEGEDDTIAGRPWGYRRRARLGLSWQASTQTINMGFREKASSKLVNITQCPILKPELNALLQPLHTLLNGLKAVCRLGHVELVLAHSAPLLVLRHLDALSADDRLKLEQFSRIHRLSLYLAGDSDTLDQVSGGVPHHHSHGLALAFSAGDFIQVNDEVNQQMLARAGVA